jgi:phage shock protein PspC (stress-responsive transcriptional regulator)
MSFLSGKKKIITMILGVVSGLAIAFGLDQTEITAVAGAVVSAASVVGYLIAEGRIDVERIKSAADAVNDVIDIFADDEEGEYDDIEGS